MTRDQAFSLYARSALLYQVPHAMLISEEMLLPVLSVATIKVAPFEEWLKITGLKLEEITVESASEFDIPPDALEKNEVAIQLLRHGFIGEPVKNVSPMEKVG